MSVEADFANALLAADGGCPPGLACWNGSSPAARFAVYRNNVIVGLIDALADSFPVTQALVGEDFFRAMAREFVRWSPPRSPVLALYGEDFADFIAGFAPAQGLPYLADMARLEYLRVAASHAADADPINAVRLEASLRDPEALAAARVALHPSLRLLRSAHAVVSLWAAHQADDVAAALAGIDPMQPQSALLCRDGLEVAIYRLDRGTATLIERLQAGEHLAAAMDAAGGDPEFDPAAALALLLRAGAVTDITTTRRLDS